MWFYQFWGTRVCSHLFFGLHNPGIYFNTSGKWQTWAHLFDQFFIIQIWSLKAIFVLWFLRRYPLIDIYKFVYLCKSLQVTKHHCFHIRSSHFKAGGIVNYLLKYTCFRCGTQALTNFEICQPVWLEIFGKVKWTIPCKFEILHIIGVTHLLSQGINNCLRSSLCTLHLFTFAKLLWSELRI